MREMKDSGIEWIGVIPNGWVVMPVKYYFAISRGRVISVFDLDENGIYPVFSSQTENDGCFGFLNTFDYSGPAITWTTDGAKAGTVFYRDGKYNCTNVCGILQLKQQYRQSSDLLFFTYAIGMVAERNKRYDINGFKIMSNEMANIKFAVPPLEEQKIIAQFLSKKCDEIDTLAANIQSQIDVLEQYKRSVVTETVTKGLNPDVEMKDSRTPWIGAMPKKWEIIRGKYILKYVQKPIREDDGIITCFRDGEVTLRSNRREDGFTIADKEIGYQGIDVGDLVVHGMDGFAGAIGISDSRGKASPVLNVLDTVQNKRYIMYYLRSMAYGDVFLALTTGIRVRSCDLRWNKLAELVYPVPPREEQEAIVAHIDATIEKANAVIADKKAQLETLDNYKKSLIYEYVTGKKEVPANV
ncbi:restriction endonuclease subunit S [Clostridium sp. MCC353]|uniref:restriction endonuclease subunit S n=1 Tax=Clostridium sp. MCC353 TaxID=2592646 RepID=UPI001C0344F3|nr:restriction endonuclease subunit S [Clostridium sp. MCC353]MBT9775363.1 restriction endonuclease subunit S [Clostridium sp. MCC353]